MRLTPPARFVAFCLLVPSILFVFSAFVCLIGNIVYRADYDLGSVEWRFPIFITLMGSALTYSGMLIAWFGAKQDSKGRH